VIVVSEVSRLANSTLQVLKVGQQFIERRVHLHVAKNGIVFDDSMQWKIIANVLDHKAEGIKLGRPPGLSRNYARMNTPTRSTAAWLRGSRSARLPNSV
jgi:hypothetical protein